MNKKRMIIAAIVLAIVLAVGGILAYFTDTETKTNVFTIGNVNITLTEPGWDETDSNNNNIPDAAEGLIPGQTVTKDPKITLESGSSNAYLFMKVKVPAIVTSGTVTKELYTYTVNNAWEEVTAKKVIGADYVEHVYVYGTVSTPTSVTAGTTTANVFPNVTVNTTITNTEAAGFASNSNIVVTAYGIQADGISASGAADIYNLFTA